MPYNKTVHHMNVQVWYVSVQHFTYLPPVVPQANAIKHKTKKNIHSSADFSLHYTTTLTEIARISKT